MSIPRTFSRSLSRCRSCNRPSTPRVTTTTAAAPFQRSFTSTSRQKADANNGAAASHSDAQLQDDVCNASSTTSSEGLLSDQATTTVSATQSSSPPLPWYLQNRPAPAPQQAALIPDLPTNPPPLLATLLDYIANTAGLDDIQLLDLRHLDPPPALGNKLIMLICTARSEKHLHVSADRMCRWLRREHGLRANAAGLLGRNELKIKLRRKAKRMKMMANVGATESEGNIDDGIRTGWICCTIGKIEAHPLDTEIPGDNVEGFVGFSEVKPGVNVVIQMFTEEKRDETDLETLWGGVVRTGARKDRVADEMLQEIQEVVQEVDAAQDREQYGEPDEVDHKLFGNSSATTEPAESASTPPTQPKTTSYSFNTTTSSTGDAFPDLTSFPSRQRRRFHTVGLRT
ncbi:unnamed protein product [Periconia digitata]|uniref:ATPase synthesis protein 25 n=1 Tax=Periconia digitata TaxID=1303443 RepID=A0A9W4UW63_9PLEO|nr:unnamed protein product [Periconia digitata]